MPSLVHDLCAVDLNLEHEAFAVHQQVSLSALDLLAAIVATFFASHPGRSRRPAADYPGAGLGVSLRANPQAFLDRSIEPPPSTVDAPFSEIVAHGGPSSREVPRKHAPLAATSYDVEDGV
jgi:hypothetical protein